jgi:hypothetical protein
MKMRDLGKIFRKKLKKINKKYSKISKLEEELKRVKYLLVC